MSDHEKSQLTLIPAERTEADARLIMNWRNNPDTLKMSYHSEPKVWDSFYQEYLDNYFENQDLRPVFAVIDKVKCAFLRFKKYQDFKISGKATDIDVNLNPEIRGKGFGPIILKMAAHNALNRGYDVVIAEIKQINTPSIRAFEKAGFEFLDALSKKVEDTGEVVPIFRYILRRARKIKWIYFDLDGTLADSISAMYSVYESFLLRFNIGASKDEFQEINGPALHEIISILKSRHRIAGDEKELIRLYRNEIISAYENSIKPIEGVAGLLNDLVRLKYKLLLVTSADKDVADTFLKRWDFGKYFSDMICGNEISKAKPDKEIYEAALKRAGSHANETLVVEDSLNGVRSAAAAGLFVAGLIQHQTHHELINAGAKTTLSWLTDLLPILEAKDEIAS